ncbi:MAG: 30S ribosomal protein S17 [Candidatus Magasanikbacteria bacterium]|jgi:small subunit ribosomal protein S17|nr:30S ribosomal protein S17 [Candidatus Magasanikbacteria bacterium]MBT4220794.1 30S ribosomal protein S17 [Candidatus Magasanikbacteria bacterium]MBT4350139.1 30S ribosomal protein S17 [Candidatus Magasanikbacteria bacterium]MBT4541418.1 30S ribosomal protein S17 [Candidatus Magasanikbacteria bacterium]MBT6253142.1 30S ribosomal protein S17 [Candidatus Magasanikbacteria bacterium]
MSKVETTQEPKKQIRRFEGIVKHAKDKTARVEVTRTVMHQKYRKQYKTHKNYAVHDEKETAEAGDTVSFVECRPFSKTKRWRLTAIVKKAA